MKRLKLFKLQTSSFLYQVILFQGREIEYKILGVGTWVSFLFTLYYLISLITLLWN